MTKVAQDVILKQISVMKDELSRLEQTVKDYFLWLDMQRSQTTHAAHPTEQGRELDCISVIATDMHTFLDGDQCIYCGAPSPKRSVGG